MYTKYLLYKHEDWSSDPQNQHFKNSDQCSAEHYYIFNLSTQKLEAGARGLESREQKQPGLQRKIQQGDGGTCL